ncbi:MAG: LacI family DNA-binding transcriptional regulator [Chthoniobacteraceae bacterium]
MPNQRAIAKAAGVTQATVSMALRNDPSISTETKERIREIAHQLQYRPNSYISSLMTHIRSGRPPQDKGCIALVVDAESEKNLHSQLETYKCQYNGMVRRAEELGFHTECFFLKASGMTPKRLNQILNARGITGLILTPPRRPGTDVLQMEWEHFATATIAYEWPAPAIDRVTTHHRHNVQFAFQNLAARGYRKIGMSIPPDATNGVDSSWKAGFLLWQDKQSPKQRVPLFIGKPGITPIAIFQEWLKKWALDAIICLIGHEKEWLDELGLRTPDDIGMVCVNRPLNSTFSGIEENHEEIGAAVVDLVAAQITRNEYGLPRHPKLILIEGTWVQGETIRLE